MRNCIAAASFLILALSGQGHGFDFRQYDVGGPTYAWMTQAEYTRFLNTGLTVNGVTVVAGSPGKGFLRLDSVHFTCTLQGHATDANNNKLFVLKLKREDPPGNFAGTWNSPRNGQVTFTQTGTSLAGTISGPGNWSNPPQSGARVTGTVRGNTARCTVFLSDGTTVNWTITLDTPGRNFRGGWTSSRGAGALNATRI